MRHRRRKLLLVVASAVMLVAVAALWWLSRPAASFDFLEGGRLVASRRENGWFVSQDYHLGGDYQDVLARAAAELERLGFYRYRNFWNIPMRSGEQGVASVMIGKGDDRVVVTVSFARQSWSVRLRSLTSRVKRRLSLASRPCQPP